MIRYVLQLICTDQKTFLQIDWVTIGWNSGFHDCVGGCNGCINFDNSDNAGLEPVVTALEAAYYDNGYDSIVTLADFYALATTVAIINAVKISNLQRSGSSTSGPWVKTIWLTGWQSFGCFFVWGAFFGFLFSYFPM